MPEKTRTAAVLGLDALSKTLLLKMLDDGHMPYLSSIASTSRTHIRELQCTPPLTMASWPSIMSGVNPGKHGIFSFYRVNVEKRRLDLYNTFWLMHPRIHEMISYYNNKIKTFMFNVIPENPIIPVRNSTVINNMFFSGGLKYHPKQLDRKLLSILEEGQKYIDQYHRSELCATIKAFEDLLDNYLIPLVEYIILKDYSLVWYNLDFPDHILHKCEKTLYNKEIQVFSGIFKRIDKIIKMFTENFDIKIIVSDHGFEAYDKIISINDILVKNNLGIKTKEPIIDLIIDEKRVNVMRVDPRLVRILEKLHLKGFAKKILHLYKKDVKVFSSQYLDPYSSDAYYLRRTYGIFFNNKSAVRKVLDILDSYSDYLTYALSNEVYKGPYIDKAPDIVVLPKDGVSFGSLELYDSDIIEKPGADHYINGVLVTIDSEADLSNYKLLNNTIVAPLIMCQMGIPVSNQIDDLHTLKELGLNCSTKDYVSKWSISKRLYYKLQRQTTGTAQ